MRKRYDEACKINLRNGIYLTSLHAVATENIINISRVDSNVICVSFRVIFKFTGTKYSIERSNSECILILIPEHQN